LLIQFECKSECFSVEKYKIIVEIKENTNSDVDSISGHREPSERNENFVKDKYVSF